MILLIPLSLNIAKGNFSFAEWEFIEKELIKQIEKALEGTNATFSRFVIDACKYALDNLEEDTKSR